MVPSVLLAASALSRQSSSGGSFGCFVVILVIGLILYLMMKGRRDRPEQLGAAKRGMASGPIADHTFPTPYVKCSTCSASGDKMKQQWDGLRKVTWTCGYCGNVAGVQELKDEELPPSARQRLGLDSPRQGLNQNFPGQGGGGVGGLLTGMMIGSMMGGGSHHHPNGDWGGGGDQDNSSDDDSGDGGSGDDPGGDGGDFGGGDSGGGDW